MRLTAERAANWLIILTAVVALPLLGLRAYDAVQARRAPAMNRYAAGETLSDSVPIEFGSAQQVIVLYVSSRCRYCTNSMDFYRRIAEARGTARRPARLVVAGREPAETLRAYVDAHGLKADQFLQVKAGESKLRLTPSLLLVDSTRHIERVWYGELDEAREQEVLAHLGFES